VSYLHQPPDPTETVPKNVAGALHTEVVMCTLLVGKSKWKFLVKLTRKLPTT
jgi:hypothetical protein